MFQVIALGMLMIRAVSVRQVFDLTARVFRDPHLGPATIDSVIVPFLQAVIPLMIVHVYQARKGSELAPLTLPIPIRYALFGAIFYLVLLFGDFEGSQFIYFQF